MLDDYDWLLGRIKSIKDEHEVMSVSKYAESTRYLPSSVTPLPGYFSFDVTPYTREIADCMSLSSPVRIVGIMKGVQLGLTVGLLENVVLYTIGHVKSAPVMMLTADKELSNLRTQQNILPMLSYSGLDHLIQASEVNGKTRKSGMNKDKISFYGGGYLLNFGANSPAKLRSFSIQFLLIDECDGFKQSVGNDGDPVKLAFDRTAAYIESRKICIFSTPTVAGQSKIDDHYKLGDRRIYKVPCKKCGFMQNLEWNMKDKSTGEIYGLVFNHDHGVLDIKSIRYICKNCGCEHKNADKYKMLNAGEWVPTARPSEPNRRSYHISGLYSPVGFKSWEDIVVEWFECWDVVNNTPKDVNKLKVFYNNNLGLPFRAENEKIKFTTISKYRRPEYRLGEIPNYLAIGACESEILLLTMAVDVHKDNLAVSVFGWTKNHRPFVIDYWRIKGNCEDISDQCWVDLRNIIYEKVYISDDDKKYRIQLALIDSGYLQHVVLEFCENTDGALPIKGLEGQQRGAQFEEFKLVKTKLGTDAINVNTGFYKERWYSSLRRPWGGDGIQPEYCFNAPIDISDDQLKELTVETKVEDLNPVTNNIRGYKWHRPSGSSNELWDLTVYNNAAIDVLAYDIMVRQGGRESVNWIDFWEYCKTGNNGLPVFYEQ